MSGSGNRPVRGQDEGRLAKISATLCSWKFWALLIALLIFSYGISGSRFADGMRSWSLDVVLKLSTPPETLKQIIVVDVDEQTYRKYFSGRRPLDRRLLGEILARLQAICVAAIAVDIDISLPPVVTGPPPNLCMNQRAPVIWGLSATKVSLNPAHARPFHGGTVGIAQAWQGEDNAVRRYVRAVVPGVGPSFIPVVAKEACPRLHPAPHGCDKPPSGARPLISFVQDPRAIQRVSASTLLEADPAELQRMAETFQGKIALVGGTYPDSNDMHFTPLGWQSGAYINAQALASELHGSALREVAGGWLLLAKILAGILMALVATLMPSRLSVFLHIIIVPVGAILAALLAASINYWLDFVPVLMAGFIDQWYEDLRYATT